MQQLRQDHRSAQARIVTDYSNRLETAIAEQVDGFTHMLAESKRAGNIRKMGIARTGVKIFSTMRDELRAAKPVALPERVRRELKDPVAAFGKVLAEINQSHTADQEKLAVTTRKGFQATLEAQGTPPQSNAKLASLLALLLEDRAPVARDKPGPPDSGESPGDGAAGAAATAPAGPQVLAASGDSEEWATIAYWHASVSSIEILEIPISGQNQTQRTKGQHMMNGAEYTSTFQPMREVEAQPGMQFRLRSVPGKEPAEVLSWPALNNDWTLTLRVRGHGEESRHVVEIQAGYAGVSELPLVPGASEALTDTTDSAEVPAVTNTVTVRFESDPPGAVVFVDGRYALRERRLLRTPMTIEVTAAPHDIVMRKRDHRDKIIRQVSFTNGQVLSQALKPDVSQAGQVVRVAARSPWQNSGIRVAKGDRLRIVSWGTWSCGSGGEAVDGNGYPNESFFKYYVSHKNGPRQIASGNYGALLIRSGTAGPIQVVGTNLQVAVRSAGVLYFDINETVLRSQRADNRGELTVQVFKRSGPRR